MLAKEAERKGVLLTSRDSMLRERLASSSLHQMGKNDGRINLVFDGESAVTFI
jgi:hypothetical protein